MAKKQTPNRRAGHSTVRRPASNASKKRLSLIFSLIIAAIAVLLVATAKPAHSQNGLSPDTDGRLLIQMSMPHGITSEIVDYEGFTLSFNADTHQPNWVAWELLGSETEGEETRRNKFQSDPEVKGCADDRDYRNSGFDRGHMAPAGDMKWSDRAMNESFLLTNVCPQAGDLNRGAWNKLELKCRQKAQADSAIIIVCGPIFKKGRPVERIGETGIPVPHAFFKAIISPWAQPPSGIGFIMPNSKVPGGIQPHAVTIDSIEAVTGYDLFSALPDSLENAIEAQCNFNKWSRPSRRR